MPKKAFLCEQCSRYVYDAEEDDFYCTAYFDEDEVGKLFGDHEGCPYFDGGQATDEYQIVRKQN